MSLKILVVDDASFTRDLIRRTLRKQFPACVIEDAINGRKAQQLLSKSKFDMVLCDWEMPEMTGVELLKWCREQPQYQKDAMPFLMITSRGDKDHVVEAVKSGVTDYLGKPFSSEQLVNKVMSAAQKHGIESKLTSQKARSGAPRANDGVASGSIDVLLNAGEKVSKGQSTAAKVTSPHVKVKEVKIPTLVRFETKQFRCMVIKLALQEATMLIKSDDVIPQVLGQAVLDLENEGTVNRLNYFVQSVATTEKKADSTFLTVTLSLIDQDAEKTEFITKLFGRL
ncbi:response regulator [Marinomonas epiphytica]